MKLIVALLILLSAGNLLAFPPFHDGLQVMLTSGDTLVAGYNASPILFDWDGDGMNDLVIACLEDVGEEKFGTIQFYQNTGTASAPDFDDFTRIMADGEIIYTLGTC